MATIPRTAKRAPSPFSPVDEIAAKLDRIKVSTQERIAKAIYVFMVWSTIAFWSMVVGYATAKGWIL